MSESWCRWHHQHASIWAVFYTMNARHQKRNTRFLRNTHSPVCKCIRLSIHWCAHFLFAICWSGPSEYLFPSENKLHITYWNLCLFFRYTYICCNHRMLCLFWPFCVGVCIIFVHIACKLNVYAFNTFFSFTDISGLFSCIQLYNSIKLYLHIFK